MTNKNPGRKLFTSRFGGVQPIPPEFIAAMEQQVEVQSVPNEVEPEPLSDTIVESEVKTDRTDERVRTTTKKKPGNIGPLKFFHTNDQGRPVQVSRLLYPTGTGLSVLPNAFTTVAVQDLGNGWSIEEVAVEGMYVGSDFVPGIFLGNLYKEEIPDVIPQEFQALIKTSTTRVDVAGIAIVPVLAPNERSEEQEQVTAFKKRVTKVIQPIPTIPATLDKGKDTNQAKQVVDVTKKLLPDATAPDIPTAVKDVSVQQLGDGNKVMETREVPSVFPAATFERQKPNLTPEKFRSAIQTVSTSAESAGIAVDPMLGATELQQRQTQTTVFTKRTESTTQAVPVLPVTLDKGVDTNQVKQTVTVIEKLMDDTTVPDVVTSKKNVHVEQLGDGRKIQRTEEVSKLHQAKVFARERPNVTPEEFRTQIPTVTTRSDADGVAADPTLGTTELRQSQEQINDLVVRTESVTQAGPTLPVVLNLGSDTNQFKQDVVVTKTLLPKITLSEVASAVKDVQVTDLGNDTKVQTTRVVPSVFDETEYVAQVAENVPSKFLSDIPATETNVVSAATSVTPPTLGATELRKSEKLLSKFTKLSRALSRVIGLPISLAGRRTDQDGQVVTVTETLQDKFTSTAQPSATKKVTVENLGASKVLYTQEDIPGVFDNAEYIAQVPDPIPERFRVAVPVTTTEHKTAGTDAGPPTLGTGDLFASQKQATKFEKVIRIATRAGIVTAQLIHKATDEVRKIVTITETYRSPGINAQPDALTTVEVQDLGNGKVLETKKAVPDLFQNKSFVTRIGDYIPAPFRKLITVKTTRLRSVGTAASQMLGTNDLQITDTQVNDFVKETETVTRDVVGQPSITDVDTNSKKQKVFVQRVVTPIATTDPIPSSTQDVSVENIDGTYKVQTIRTISPDVVFNDQLFERTIPETIPVEFRDQPTIVDESVTAGTVGNPALIGGELAHSEQQVDKFNKKTRSVTRNANLGSPRTLTEQRFDGPDDGRGSKHTAIVTRTKTLASGAQTADTGFNVIDSQVRQLGAGVTEKQTSVIANYQTLTNSETDPITGIVTDKFKTIVDPATAIPAPTVGTSFSKFALDGVRSLQVQEVVRSIGTAGTLITDVGFKLFGTTNVELPIELTGVKGITTQGGGGATYSSNGTFDIFDRGSGSLSVRGSCGATSICTQELTFDTKQVWGNDIACTNLLFYVTNAVARSAILTRCGQILGLSNIGVDKVNDWPKFAPTPVSFTLASERVSITSSAEGHATASTDRDYAGTVILASYARASGKGLELSADKTVKVIRLPATIHGGLSLTGTTSDSNTWFANSTITVTNIDIVATGNLAATALCSCTPTSISPTTSGSGVLNTLPNTGWYLHRLFMEPYKNGYLKVQAEVVNFADLGI